MATKTSIAPVTLITDFGLYDEYVGVIKGVLLSFAPTCQIIDISHLVPPHDVLTASYLLSRSAEYFPPRTVHLVIVDPGVGSDRAILVIAANGQYFVGPDNGVFSSLFDNAASIAIHKVKIPVVSSAGISSTFHGRDIMAPIAAKLIKGVAIGSFGPAIDPIHCVVLQKLKPIASETTLEGMVIHIDRFGNFCTTITKGEFYGFSLNVPVEIVVPGWGAIPLGDSYADLKKGTVLALFDSHNHLEIAENQGNAAVRLGITVGAKILLHKL